MTLTNRIIRPFAIFMVLVLTAAIVAVGRVQHCDAERRRRYPASAAAASGVLLPLVPRSLEFNRTSTPTPTTIPAWATTRSSDTAVIQQHIAAMQYGGIQAGISSWWGQGTRSDNRLPTLLATTAGSPFRWSIYYEQESQGDPSVSALTADLTYLRDHYGSDPSYLRINGRFVVFVYAAAADGCGMADRWAQANTVNAYIVLKVFSGYKTCASQPSGWHQYSPAVAADSQGQFSYSISPGFSKVGENPRLGRDIARWQQNVQSMVASGAQFQLITTFNEWGEGTWSSRRRSGPAPRAMAPTWTRCTTTLPAARPRPCRPPPRLCRPPPRAVPPSAAGTSLTFAAAADARVVETNPTANYGTASPYKWMAPATRIRKATCASP